jgi:alpha-tubulin suppressor-like RCC1 family protein
MRAWVMAPFIFACGGRALPKDDVARPRAYASASSAAPQTTSTTVPPIAAASATPTQIAAGGEVTCARMSDATVRCWGKNEFGQVGEGAKNEQGRERFRVSRA